MIKYILLTVFVFSICFPLKETDDRYDYGNDSYDYKTKRNTKERLLEEIEEQKIVIAKAEKEMLEYPANKLYFEKKIIEAKTIITKNEKKLKKEEEKKNREQKKEEEKKNREQKKEEKRKQEEKYRIEQALNWAKNKARKPSLNTDSDVMNYWIGYHQKELIKAWGPPNRTADDGDGGTILIYSYKSEGKTKTVMKEFQKTTVGGYSTTITGRKLPGGYKIETETTGAYNLQKMYYADANGKIYHWLIR